MMNNKQTSNPYQHSPLISKQPSYSHKNQPFPSLKNMKNQEVVLKDNQTLTMQQKEVFKAKNQEIKQLKQKTELIDNILLALFQSQDQKKASLLVNKLKQFSTTKKYFTQILNLARKVDQNKKNVTLAYNGTVNKFCDLIIHQLQKLQEGKFNSSTNQLTFHSNGLVEKLIDLDTYIKKLQKANQDHAVKNINLSNEMQKLKQQQNSKGKYPYQQVGLEKKYKDLQGNYTTISEKQGLQQKQIQKLINEKQRLEEKLQSNQKKLMEREKKLQKDFLDYKSKIQEEISKHNTKVQKIQKQYSSNIGTKQKQLSEQKRLYQILERQIKSLKEQHQKQLIRHKKDSQKPSVEINRITDLLSKKQKQIEVMIQELNAEKIKNQRIIQEISDYSKREQQMLVVQKQYNEVISRRDAENSELSNQIKKLKQQNIKYRSNINQSQEKLSQIASKLAHYQKLNIKISEENVNYSIERQSLEQKIEKLQQKLKKIETQLSNKTIELTTERKKYIKEIEHLKEESSRKEEQIKIAVQKYENKILEEIQKKEILEQRSWQEELRRKVQEEQQKITYLNSQNKEKEQRLSKEISRLTQALRTEQIKGQKVEAQNSQLKSKVLAQQLNIQEQNQKGLAYQQLQESLKSQNQEFSREINRLNETLREYQNRTSIVEAQSSYFISKLPRQSPVLQSFQKPPGYQVHNQSLKLQSSIYIYKLQISFQNKCVLVQESLPSDIQVFESPIKIMPIENLANESNENSFSISLPNVNQAKNNLKQTLNNGLDQQREHKQNQLLSQLAFQQKAVQMLQARHDKDQEEKEQLFRRIQEYHSKIQRLTQKLNEANQKVQTLHQDNEPLVRQLRIFQENYDNQKAVNKSLKLTIEQQHKVLDEQIYQSSKLKEQNSKLQLENKRLQEQLAHISLQNQEKIKKLTMQHETSKQQLHQNLQRKARQFQLMKQKIDAQYVKKEQVPDFKRQAQIAIQKDEVKQMVKQIQSSYAKLRQLEALVESYQNKLGNAKQTENNLKSQIVLLTEEKKKLEVRFKNKSEEADLLDHQVKQLSTSNQDLIKMYSQLQQSTRNSLQEETYRSQLQQMEKFVQSQNQKIAYFQRQMRQFGETISKKQALIEQLQLKLKQSMANEERMQGQILQMDQKWKKFQRQAQRQKQSLCMKILEAQTKIEILERQSKKPKHQQLLGSDNPDFSAYILFQNRVLQDYPEHKVFLKSTIEKSLGRRILRTKLIYAMDPLNNINIHKYVDKKQNIIVVIRLVNGYYLAAFAQDYFQPKRVSTKSGLIFSLTNKQVFTLAQKNKKAISYDDFFVIFGNSQVRLKTGQKKVFSNFAVSNGYFNSRGLKVSVLFGGGPQDREMVMEDYEFYQIQFY